MAGPEQQQDAPINRLGFLGFIGDFGTVTTFILVNGLVIAAIIFVIIHLATTGVTLQEAKKTARDILTRTEQHIQNTEKTLEAMGYFYAAMDNPDPNMANRLQRVVNDHANFQGLLWATDQNIWMQEDLSRRSVNKSYDPRLGWPNFQTLYEEMSPVSFGSIKTFSPLVWEAFRQNNVDAKDKYIGFAIKTRNKKGSIGVFLAVTTPKDIFGNIWAGKTDGINRIFIRDRETSNTIIDQRFDLIQSGAGKGFGVETVEESIKIGDVYWDIELEVHPSLFSQFVIMAPWAIGGFVLLLTIILAGIAERKNRQDERMAQMSETLAGTHNELQAQISERDKLFQALRKSEREHRALINSVSDVIFETDEKGRLLFLNDTWNRMTNRNVEETVGLSLFGLMEKEEQEKQRLMFEELVRGERQAYRVEVFIDIGEQNYKPVDVAFSMLRMAEDKSVRVVGSMTDIEKRRRAEKAVREAEMRFRTIVENSISGIYQTSPDGRFVSANKALADILGYDSAEDLVFSVSDVATQIYVHPEEREQFVQKLLFEGRISGLEYQVYRKNGEKIWIMENARVVRSEKGGVAYYEGSVWDVTERREAEEAMRNAHLEAEISSRSRMEFLANMSHELRTPLNAVIGFSEIIKDEVMGPINVPVYREYAKDIYNSGNYLLKVISEILEVSKIETGNRELNISAFKIMRAIKSCMVIMSSRIEQSGVDVHVSIPEDLPDLMAEELGFKQMILNLIGNAIKFTEEGGKVDITAYLEKTGEMYIDITDTGIGMSAEEIEKAMTPFGKVDTTFSGMKEGTGLGLTIVESIVKLHGGTFKLISEKGKGTTARIIFPSSCVLNRGGSSSVEKTPVQLGKTS